MELINNDNSRNEPKQTSSAEMGDAAGQPLRRNAIRRESKIYFTDFFDVSRDALADYGAFNVSCVVDLPLFIDPFLLFTSKKPEYQALHAEMIDYLKFLRDKSLAGSINEGLLRAWYCFPEVRQNRLGFCLHGNAGRGLGINFAKALNDNLNNIFKDFGTEKVTGGSHLEKLALIRRGVGKDNISDFTTNLIKAFLLRYTEEFAKTHIKPQHRRKVMVERTIFNYEMEVWTSETYELPWLDGDYVVLTPEDLLTQDDTWINKEDLRNDFSTIRKAIDNEALRSEVNNYFQNLLPKNHTQKEENEAVQKTLSKFPALIDYYIRNKEHRGAEAVRRSAAKVREADCNFVQVTSELVDLIAQDGKFYSTPARTIDETRQKIGFLKHVIENQDGYRFFYVDKKPVQREMDLQILFKLVWHGSPSSADAEVNNGRGPVDFKISRGSKDNTLVEFKLASNSQLKRNLQNQVAIYEKANKTAQSFKVVMFFTESEEMEVRSILSKLKPESGAGIILIDARNDNKPSASKA